MVVHTCNPSYLGDGGRRITLQGEPRQKCKTLAEKQTKAKRTDSLAQVVKYLPSFMRTSMKL
jgi:hypothetical protein